MPLTANPFVVDYPCQTWSEESAAAMVGRPVPAMWCIGPDWIVSEAEVLDGGRILLVTVEPVEVAVLAPAPKPAWAWLTLPILWPLVWAAVMALAILIVSTR